VSVTNVLLNDVFTYARPMGMFFFALRPARLRGCALRGGAMLRAVLWVVVVS
jgi:hypothetical protein